MSSLDIAALILAVMLLLSLAPMPYGYYTLVRLFTMVIMICYVVKFLEKKNTASAVAAGTIALLFQPFFKIVLDKMTWHFVDIIVSLLLVAFVISQFLRKGN